MKWYWIVAIVVAALLIGFGISFAVNGGGATLKIKTPEKKSTEQDVNDSPPENVTG
jgi:hypothetical protein